MEDAVQQAKTQADKNELLCWAAARGLLADTMELLAQGAEAKTVDKNGLAPVHFAAAHGHLDVLQFLASKGADLDVEDPKGRQPLHHAVVGHHADVAKYLAGKSAWLEAPDFRDDTALHLASRQGWTAGCELLLAAGAKPAAPNNKRGLSPLGEALAGGHLATAQVLLSAGADPTATADGFSLLHVVAGLGHAECVSLLLKQKGVSAKAANNADGATPLHAAALSGNEAVVKLLLKHGADPAATSKDGLQPHHLVTDDTQAAAVLRKLLHTSKAPAAPSGAPSPAVAPSKAAAATKATDSSSSSVQTAVERYCQAFRQLGPAEQQQRVVALSQASLQELDQKEGLSSQAKEAVFLVRQRQQLLAAYMAIAMLRADAAFQEDASDPAVREALQNIQETRNAEGYKQDRAVLSVMTKLSKLQAVLRQNGALKVSLDQLLVLPGQTFDQVKDADQAKVKELQASLVEAINAAIAAIAGPTAAGSTQVSKVSTEIEEVKEERASVEGGSSQAAPSGGSPQDLDDLLLREPEEGAVAGGGTWQQQMWKAFVESSLQAMKMLLMMAVLYGILWWLGMLPVQQDLTRLLQQQQQQ